MKNGAKRRGDTKEGGKQRMGEGKEQRRMDGEWRRKSVGRNEGRIERE